MLLQSLFQISDKHFKCDVNEFTICIANQIKEVEKSNNFVMKIAARTPSPGYYSHETNCVYI